MCAVFRVLQVRLIKWAKETLFFNAIQNTYQLPCVGRWFPTFSRTWSRLQKFASRGLAATSDPSLIRAGHVAPCESGNMAYRCLHKSLKPAPTSEPLPSRGRCQGIV